MRICFAEFKIWIIYKQINNCNSRYSLGDLFLQMEKGRLSIFVQS